MTVDSSLWLPATISAPFTNRLSSNSATVPPQMCNTTAPRRADCFRSASNSNFRSTIVLFVTHGRHLTHQFQALVCVRPSRRRLTWRLFEERAPGILMTIRHTQHMLKMAPFLVTAAVAAAAADSGSCPGCHRPTHSWETLPVSFHSARTQTDDAGRWTAADIQTIAKFPLVTVRS